MPALRPSAGVSLLELIVVLGVVSILAAAAVPKLTRFAEKIRARAVLDQIVGELYRARMLAVETGRPVHLVLGSAPTGCVDRVRLLFGPPEANRAATLRFGPGTACVRHNGDSLLVFNARGMLRPPGRSIYVGPPVSDSIVLSIAGRIRRSE